MDVTGSVPQGAHYHADVLLLLLLLVSLASVRRLPGLVVRTESCGDGSPKNCDTSTQRWDTDATSVLR